MRRSCCAFLISLQNSDLLIFWCVRCDEPWEHLNKTMHLNLNGWYWNQVWFRFIGVFQEWRAIQVLGCTNSTSAWWCTTSPLFLCQWHASRTQNMSSRRETSPVLIAAHFNKPVLHRWSKRAVFTWEAGPVMYSGAAFPRVAGSSWAERASSGP